MVDATVGGKQDPERHVDRCVEKLECLSSSGDKALWITLISECSELFNSDDQLRGHLAHAFRFFHSPASACQMSLTGVVIAIASFQGQLNRISSGTTHEVRDLGTIRKFLDRQYNTIQDYRIYFNLLMFMAATGRTNEEVFFRHFIMQELGSLRPLLGRLISSLRVEASIKGLLDEVRNFQVQNTGKRVIESDLGGMLELGNPDRDFLWQSIFHRTKADYLGFSGRPSEERYYVCYRYSTSGNLSRMAKSFLVIQSPGDVREHFAFKAFYRSSAGQLRKSSGSIVALGNVVAFFGSSRRALGTTESFEPDLTGKSLLGPKALFLSAEAFRNQEPLLPGHLVSLNEKDKLFSSRIVCIPTDITHSRDAQMGTISVLKSQDELGRFTVFGEGKSNSIVASRREMLWATVCEMLKPDPENRVELCLGYGDFDLREFIEGE